MEGMAVDGMDEHCALTTFQNVAGCSVLSRGRHEAHNPLHTTDATVVTDIATYLSRPYVITTGTLNQSTAGILWQSDLNIASYYSSNPNWPKTVNVYGMRATVCFKAQVLATPQNSGIFRLCYQPIQGNRVDLLQLSYLPHAELDLLEGTEVTLKIPYIHYNTYMVRNDGSFKLGKAYFYATVAPGYGTGELPATYRIWSWLEDVELIGSTAAETQAYVAQSGNTKFPLKPIKTVATTSKKAATAKEVPPAALSSILAAGGVAANFVGSMIPSLKSFTGSTAWVLNYAANMAYSFGWSKPRSDAPIVKMFRSANTGQHNVDGVSNCHNLGLLAENAISPEALGGTNVDEMSLAYVLSRFGMTTRFAFNTSQAVDTDLYTFTVGPQYLVGSTSGNSTTAPPASGTIAVSMLNYYANEFKLWRGTIKVKLHAALTRFHAGRLLVGFVPSNGTALPLTASGLNYMSVVWDLKDSSVLEFDIPFVYPRPYCEYVGYTGSFFVRILDQLVAPKNVSAIVPISVEFAGGPDFECARPANPTMVANDPTPTFVAQSGNSVFRLDEKSPADLCIGEGIRSIKQLINKAVFQGSILYDTYANFTNLNYSTSVNGAQATKYKACYALWRGSYDYHFMPNRPDTFMTAAIASTTTFFANPQNLGVVSENLALHVSVPFYSDTPYNALGKSTAGNSDFTLFATRPPAQTADANAGVAVFGNYGDDTQFYFFLGPPLVSLKPVAMGVFDDSFFLWACRKKRTIPGLFALLEEQTELAQLELDSSEIEKI